MPNELTPNEEAKLFDMLRERKAKEVKMRQYYARRQSLLKAEMFRALQVGDIPSINEDGCTVVRRDTHKVPATKSIIAQLEG